VTRRAFAFRPTASTAQRFRFASYNWNRRSNTRQFGEQQGVFPILALDSPF
jgi:hypothetical protein